MRNLFRFPNPVNETSARLVAAGVVLQCAGFLVFRQWWLLLVLGYGFVARVATGPTLSPLGQIVTRAIVPYLARSRSRSDRPPRLVPGPPKRFAQGIGATLSVGAVVAWAFGERTVAVLLIAAILCAATLESVLSLCLGCVLFNRLVRWGAIPHDICEACNDLTLRRPGQATTQASAMIAERATT